MIYLRGAFRKVHGEDTSSRAVWKGISEGFSIITAGVGNRDQVIVEEKCI